MGLLAWLRRKREPKEPDVVLDSLNGHMIGSESVTSGIFLRCDRCGRGVLLPDCYTNEAQFSLFTAAFGEDCDG